MTTEIDHVIVAVADLRDAAEWWRTTTGLGVSTGGRHPGGTENLCIPLGGTQYLELITVFDRSNPDAADWIRFIDSGGGLSSWAVKTDDVPGCAARTASPIVEGWSERSDGSRGGGWVTVGSAGAFQSHGELPFFIERVFPLLREAGLKEPTHV